jgi:NAD(P)-dependent dehydrogenase (short-subunit alcohol dehydrogenase family)
MYFAGGHWVVESLTMEVIRVIQAFYPMLAQSARPRIVNVTSGLGSISTREGHHYYAYSTSKAALNMLTRGIASELCPML